MLQRLRQKEGAKAQILDTEFSAFLKNKGPAAANLTPEQREALFREFLLWREMRGTVQR
jgi:hypothetical protein